MVGGSAVLYIASFVLCGLFFKWYVVTVSCVDALFLECPRTLTLSLSLFLCYEGMAMPGVQAAQSIVC